MSPSATCASSEAACLCLDADAGCALAGLGPLLLDMQYRMHPAIAEFPSAQFYAGRLKTGIAAAERPLPQGVLLLLQHCNQCCDLLVNSHFADRVDDLMHARAQACPGPTLAAR